MLRFFDGGLKKLWKQLDGRYVGSTWNRVVTSHMSTGGSYRKPAGLDASRLTVIRKQGVKTPLPPLAELRFGEFFSDHFLDVNWDSTNGWNAPFIRPLEPIQLHPAASSLHYALQAFEGLKAFKSESGEVLMFRPDLNLKRLNSSAQRLALPTFDESELHKLIMELLKVDQEMIPQAKGYSMYLRPTIFSTYPCLGVRVPKNARLNVILSPCGPYYPTGFKPIQLKAETKFARAFPGGCGDYKVGGNYGATIYPQQLAANEGYGQVLWLYAVDDDYMMTEVGTSNMFVFWTNERGEKELVTPRIDRNLILPGITRQSVLELCRSWDEFKVTERDILMKKDFLRALKENRILEVFASGTAAVVTPIDAICFEETVHHIPLDPKNPSSGSGPLAKRLMDSIFDIQYGRRKHPWSVPLSTSGEGV
eukprot:GHVS01081142.1.p1 GENE.GHVS01081142.1~~GHVS01081142.1.p1  ORF type:complete len:422 (-),score=22.21 GHVS01081142.1:230-1495(-)